MSYIDFTELSDLNLSDLMSSKTKQLDALAVTMVGDGFEVFSNSNDDIQHNLLWTISELASELRQANDEQISRRSVGAKIAA